MSDEKSSGGIARIPLGMGSGTIHARPTWGTSPQSEGLLRFFSAIPLFSLLHPEEVMALVRACTIKTYSAGAVIFEEGEAADSMLIIEQGEVSISVLSSHGEIQVASLGGGSLVGEMALIAGGPRSATVKAIAETRVYCLDGAAFEALRGQESVAAYKVLRKLLETLGDRAAQVRARINEIFRNPEAHLETYERYSQTLANRASKV